MSQPDFYETFSLQWKGIAICIRYAPLCFGGISSHLEVTTPNKAPLPITGTGYRSHFLPCGTVESLGGALAYVTTWLDQEAESPEWQEQFRVAGQLSLF